MYIYIYIYNSISHFLTTPMITNKLIFDSMAHVPSAASPSGRPVPKLAVTNSRCRRHTTPIKEPSRAMITNQI